MFQELFHKLWKHLNLADSLMIWFMELSLECYLATLFKVSCLMLLPASEKRMKVSTMTKQINVTFVTCQEKWCKRKESPSLNILKTNISCGIMSSILSPLRERTATITQVSNMKSPKNTIFPMRKWMSHGFPPKDNLNLVLLMRPINLYTKLSKTAHYFKKS